MSGTHVMLKYQYLRIVDVLNNRFQQDQGHEERFDVAYSQINMSETRSVAATGKQKTTRQRGIKALQPYLQYGWVDILAQSYLQSIHSFSATAYIYGNVALGVMRCRAKPST